MKKIVGITLGLVCAHQLMAAEPIDSKVIHHDTYVGIGYGYLHDIGGSDVAAHGILGQGSYDIQNVLLGVSGGYFWADEGDVNLWNAGGSVGYVVRLMENHINIIPRVGIRYNEVLFDGDSADITTLEPGITLSYAINNQISVNGGYTYVRDIDFDNDEDGHGFNVGARLALAENIGLDVSALFADGQGFSGATAVVSFHF